MLRAFVTRTHHVDVHRASHRRFIKLRCRHAALQGPHSRPAARLGGRKLEQLGLRGGAYLSLHVRPGASCVLYTYELCVPASCVMYVPETQGSLLA